MTRATTTKTVTPGSEKVAPPVEYSTESFRCPVCGTQFAAESPIPGAYLGRDTDLKPRFAVADPIAFLLQACPSCRYAAGREGFESTRDESDDELGLPLRLGDRPALRSVAPSEDDLEDLRRWIGRGELVSGLPHEGRELSGAEKYVLAARCREFLGEDDLTALAEFYLRGSWCARAGGDRDMERTCQRDAVVRLQQALDHSKILETDRSRSLYLIAELSRRSGDFPRAVDLFSQLEGAHESEQEEDAFFARLASRQMALAVVQSAVDAVISDDLLEVDDDEPLHRRGDDWDEE